MAQPTAPSNGNGSDSPLRGADTGVHRSGSSWRSQVGISPTP